MKLVFSDEQLRKVVPLQDGDVFNVAKIHEGLGAIHKLYGTQGYINFVATPITEVNRENHHIAIIMEFDEGCEFSYWKHPNPTHDLAAEEALNREFPPESICASNDLDERIQQLFPGRSHEHAVLHKSEKISRI